MNFLTVFIGGGIGALMRYLIAIPFINKNLFLPYHTLIGNIIGCFVAGLIMGVLILTSNYNPFIKTLIITGFCGGLTTFSTFSLETVNFIQSGDYIKALIYILISLFICIISVILGIALVKKYV